MGFSPSGGWDSLPKLTKREDVENRLCDSCYSGEGTAIVVRNLIGICERASPRHRRWQEMREAEQDKRLGGVYEGRQHTLYFLIRDRSRREQKQGGEKRVPHNKASDKDADRSDLPRDSIQMLGTHHVSTELNPFFLTLLLWRYDTCYGR